MNGRFHIVLFVREKSAIVGLAGTHPHFTFELYQDDQAIGAVIRGTGGTIYFPDVKLDQTATFSIGAVLKTDENCFFDPESRLMVQVEILAIDYETVPESEAGNDGRIDLCISGGTPPYTVEYQSWRGSVTSMTGPCIEISGLRSGYYQISAMDTLGCTDSKLIQVDHPGPRPVGFPQRPVLTPNGDGFNDILIFEGLLRYPENNELIIYDRYGGVILHERPYRNDWEGRYQGQLLPTDTYFYTLCVFPPNEPTIIYRGHITLIR